MGTRGDQARLAEGAELAVALERSIVSVALG